MKLLLVCATLIAAVFQISDQQCLQATLGTPHMYGHKVLYSGQQQFSLDLLNAIHQLNPQDNIFFSPYSTYHALLLAYFISGNQTEASLKSTLKLSSELSKQDIFQAYKTDRLATKLRTKNSSYEFTSANRIYAAQQTNFRECMFDIFKDELIKANFVEQPEVIRKEINTWVQNYTHDMIKDLLPPGTIGTDTNLVLVNAGYFKGIWEHRFNADDTKPEVFFISRSKQTTVDMMHLEATLNFDASQTLGAHILELPYQGEDISMYILLPPFTDSDEETNGIETVLKNLNLENFKSVVNGSLLPRQVQVSLPKFSLERKLELVPILESLGVGNIFDSDADFSFLSNSNDLSLGAGIHKAKIELTEEGTRAAAATAIFTWRMMTDDSDTPVIFRCDRPFVFLLYNKMMNTVLFLGVLRQPEGRL